MTSSLEILFTPSTSSRGRGRWRHSRSFCALAFPTPHREIAKCTTLPFSAKSDRWASFAAMYSGKVINHSELTELRDESDFEKLASSNNYLLSICGYGSLLSERSARSTFPDLINFRVARLNGFRRIFAHVSPGFFARGIAKPETMEISGLSVEPCEGENLIITLFEIHRSEIQSYIKREIEYRFLAVFPETLDGTPYTSPAVLCASYSDEEFLQIRCKDDYIQFGTCGRHKHIRFFRILISLYCVDPEILPGSKEMFFKQYGQYNIHKIWRDDVFPCRVYLRHCLLAAKSVSDVAYNNFLDHSFLADRKTTIREYLATTGSGIMEEEPPESLKARYGG